MRARISAVALAAVLIVGLGAHDAAAVMNVAMSPTSGPSGTTVSAASNDVCEPHTGSVVVWQAARASEDPPEDNDGGWSPVIESDHSAADGDAPWSGTFNLGETSGQFALEPGAYTIFFACGYYEEGAPIAYGDYSPRAFQVCPTGVQTCAPPAPTTTPTTRSTSARPTGGSTTLAPATTAGVATTTATTVAESATTTTSRSRSAVALQHDDSPGTPWVLLAIATTALLAVVGGLLWARGRVT